MLSTDRNERMIEAASAKPGPLTLPVHLEDLPPAVQRQVQLLAVRAQQDYCQMGMDPCLDMQALVSLPTMQKRIEWLAYLVSRERQRLETIASNPRPPVRKETEQEPRRGAWFDNN